MIDLESIHIYNENNAIIVGEQGLMIITRDGGETWYGIPLNLINASGKSHFLLDPTYNLPVVDITDSHILLILKIVQASETHGNSILYNTLAPKFANKEKNTVLYMSGNMNTSVYASINNGDLRTTMDDFLYLTSCTLYFMLYV